MPFGLAPDPVTRAPDALQRHRNRARRTQLNDEIDRADVDAQLERGGRYNDSQLAASQAPLDVETQLARQTAVVRHREAFAEAFVECEGDTLAHAARSDEDQRRLMVVNLSSDPIVDLAPHLFARDGAELVAGNFYGELHFATVPNVDDRRALAQELRDALQGAYGGRKADALRFSSARLCDQVIQTRERERQMRAALVRRHRMNLVDDNRGDACEKRPRLLGRQQDVQRLRRRYEHVRRLSQHALALGGGRIAGAHGGANRRHRQALGSSEGGQRGERFLQVLADVVGEGLERRDVHHQRLLGQRAFG